MNKEEEKKEIEIKEENKENGNINLEENKDKEAEKDKKISFLEEEIKKAHAAIVELKKELAPKDEVKVQDTIFSSHENVKKKEVNNMKDIVDKGGIYNPFIN